MMRAAAIAILLAQPVAGAAEHPDPIDVAMDACLAGPGGQSTFGMVSCTSVATEAWDKRLNQVYQQVMRGLDPKSQDLLRSAQRRWVAFREAERAALGGPWRQTAGTIAQVTTGDAILAATKERVQELQVYGGE